MFAKTKMLLKCIIVSLSGTVVPFGGERTWLPPDPGSRGGGGVPTCLPLNGKAHAHALQPAAWLGGLGGGAMWLSWRGGRFHLYCFPYTLERDLNHKHMSQSHVQGLVSLQDSSDARRPSSKPEWMLGAEQDLRWQGGPCVPQPLEQVL